MLAYKGLNKDLTCLGYQFFPDRVNVTELANCRANGFHCAENPLDCLCYYRDWKNSVYYLVQAEGDLDEDGWDSKIACTHMRLLKELSIEELLLHGLAYMARHPNRTWNSYVIKEKGTAGNGFAIVRGKSPLASGKKGDILAIAKEKQNNSEIQDAGLFVIDGEQYREDVWYDVYGEERSPIVL